ncbi:MAG: DUF455 family protein [Planctomycetes bacterium]|nr:DUF455 family protein [Planctomycetota bacterium]
MSATTIEDWARHLVTTTQLADKLAPPPPPADFDERPRIERIAAPGRPTELVVVARSPRSLRRGELRDPHKRARQLHAMAHHELQAAELFAWAILAFADAPRDFRAGLLRLCLDELRHLRAYARRLVDLGSRFGAHPVRDWFWQRVPDCRTPLQFAALVGLGLEGGNLDHAARCAEEFLAVGDDESAAVQRMVERDEIEHVRFAAQWFATWTGGLSFDRWRRELVAPLTPTMMRGRTINRTARAAAGLDAEFLDALAAWEGPPQ